MGNILTILGANFGTNSLDKNEVLDVVYDQTLSADSGAVVTGSLSYQSRTWIPLQIEAGTKYKIKINVTNYYRSSATIKDTSYYDVLALKEASNNTEKTGTIITQVHVQKPQHDLIEREINLEVEYEPTSNFPYLYYYVAWDLQHPNDIPQTRICVMKYKS